MRRRLLCKVGLSIGGALTCAALGYACFAVPAIPPHQGDGVFEDLSRRMGIFPITGYSIRFAEFALDHEYEESFHFSSVPSIGKKCGVYLAIRDPEGYWYADRHIKELQATMQLELLDSRGATVVKTGGKMKDFTWYGCRDLHALHRTNESFFIARTHEEYTLRLVYRPDPQLASYKGFGYLLCGGSK